MAAPRHVLVLLDSTVLREDIDLDGLDWEYLRAYSQRGSVRILVPNVVRLEVEKFIDASVERMAGQIGGLHDQLRRYGISARPTGQGRDASNWRQRARSHFSERLEWLGAEILPIPATDNDATVKALLAEKLPFGKGGDKGYRDYLIWKTLIAEGTQDLRAPQTAHFITRNLKDFTSGGQLDSGLAREALMAGLTVHLHPGLREFSERVARKALPVDQAASVALGKSSELQKLTSYVDGNLPQSALLEALEAWGVLEAEVEAFVAYWTLQDDEGGTWDPDPDDVSVELEQFECLSLSDPSQVRALGADTVAFEAVAEIEVNLRTEGLIFGEREYAESWSPLSFKVGFTLDMSHGSPEAVGDVTLLE